MNMVETVSFEECARLQFEAAGWECAVCTFAGNPNETDVCTMCASPNPHFAESIDRAAQQAQRAEEDAAPTAP